MAENTAPVNALGNESPEIEFPAGLVGFEEWKSFVVVSHQIGGPLQLLQSLDNERVSFLTTDPAEIVVDYAVALTEEDARELKYDAGATVLHPPWPKGIGVYCVLSVQEEPFGVMANLLGPLVINYHANIGRQIILSESGYPVRYAIVGESFSPDVKMELLARTKAAKPC